MILFNCMLAVYALLSLPVICSKINREQVVRRFNPHRNASSKDTPMQVGNGNFAFGADVTGLQTFLPFNILSSWAWHNSSLPTTPNQTEPSDFTGLDWDTHGRLVNYEQPNPAEPDISQWMISNPHRVNLGRVGLWFKGGDVTEDDLASKSQYLDLYTGMMSSSFLMGGHKVSVQTIADPYTSTIAVKLDSDAIRSGDLGVFFDYPYMNDTNKFEAPFVGNWNAVTNHTTSVKKGKRSAVITHKEDALTYYTTVSWDEDASMSDALPDSHRYVLTPKRCTSISFTVAYSPQSQVHTSQYNSIVSSSAAWWGDYWEKGNFVDLTASGNATAVELQRRVILSQYLLAVNSAGHWFPQESGLTDNGW